MTGRIPLGLQGQLFYLSNTEIKVSFANLSSNLEADECCKQKQIKPNHPVLCDLATFLETSIGRIPSKPVRQYHWSTFMP